MNYQETNGDKYFNSIKQIFIPFILLNIVAVVLGASAVNIINILLRSTDNSFLINNPKNLEAMGSNSATTELESILPISKTGDEMVSSTFLSAIGNHTIESATAYPEPNLLSNFPWPESEPEHDKNANTSPIVQTAKDPAKESRVKHESVAQISREPEFRQLILPTLGVVSEVIDIPIANDNWDISHLNSSSGILDGFAKHPGDSGALVIAAHATTNWPTAGPFEKLRLMNLGDPIVFRRGNTDYVYEISQIFRVATTDVDILHKNGEDGIVLVTCGNYNYFTGSYGSRIVVYGNLKETQEVAAQSSP